MPVPTHCPGCFGRAQIPLIPQVKSEDRLKLQGVLRCAVWRCVSEGNWVQCKEAYQQPGNTRIDGAEGRASLPRALTGTSGGRSWKHKGWSETNHETCFLSIGPRQNCDIE